MTEYQVWCLDWEDDESEACKIRQVDVGAGIVTTRGVITRFHVSGPAGAAEIYADFCHHQRDGWESSWPLKFRVRCPDGTTVDYDVERETVPEFTARKATT